MKVKKAPPPNESALDELCSGRLQERLQRAKDHKAIEALRSETESILKRFEVCCIPDRGEIRWPLKKDMERLDEVIEKMCHLKRKRPRSLWKCYTFIDHEWQKLRLCKRVEGLAQRAIKNVPPRPMLWFLQLSAGQDKAAQLATEFGNACGALRRATTNSKTTDWIRFKDLMLRFRNEGQARKKAVLEPKIKDSAASPAIVAYTVALEICIEDAAWSHKYYQGLCALSEWLRYELENVDIFHNLALKFETPEGDLDETGSVSRRNLMVNRLRAKLRQQKCRAKKSPQKA